MWETTKEWYARMRIIVWIVIGVTSITTGVVLRDASYAKKVTIEPTIVSLSQRVSLIENDNTWIKASLTRIENTLQRIELDLKPSPPEKP